MTKKELELMIGLLFCLLGAIFMIYFNYYDDFIKPKTMTLEDIIFYNRQYHFSPEKSIGYIFFAFSSALLLESFGFWNIEKYVNRKIIKEKIKEGKKELRMYPFLH